MNVDSTIGFIDHRWIPFDCSIPELEIDVSGSIDDEHDTDHMSSGDGVHFIGSISIVVEHDIRSPNIRRGNFDDIDPAVLTGYPNQFIICPFLGRRENVFPVREVFLSRVQARHLSS